MSVTPQHSGPPAHPHYGAFKCATDQGVGLLLAIGFLPAILLIALIIKLDSPGPVFFRQRRGGLNGKSFKIYKFRTMLREAAFDESVPQAKPKDPRLTGIGKWLRRLSLDELPQLINVVRGEMSLVGPRPHAVFHDTLFAQRCTGYEGRFRVKPGLTGLAQVSGLRGLVNSDEDIQRRTDLDNYYINHWSPKLEIKIIAKTLRALVRAVNAH